MEDYIFIIIAIVLSAIGAINRNKKQKMARMNDDDLSFQRKPSVFDHFLEEFDDEPDFVTEPEPTPKVVKETRPKMQVMQTPAKKVANKHKKAPVLVEEEDEGESIRASILDDFSIRKAVIYSEILNRKY